MKIIFFLPICVLAQFPNNFNRFLGADYLRGKPPDLKEMDESLRDYPGQNLLRKELTGSFPHPRPIGSSIGNYPERLTFPSQNAQAMKPPKVLNIGMVPPPFNRELQTLRENFNPSAGMHAYWGDDDDPKIKIKKYMERQKANTKVMYRNTPKMETDDYQAPIRWVPINSSEINDGLARVTDPKTGKNRQQVINGTIYVPIVDYGRDRLELTTPTANKTAASSPAIDFSKVSPRDWLVQEMVRPRSHGLPELQCEIDGCQARCGVPSCETGCSGDTCAAGCTGNSCLATCDGPGCKSMCIGRECVAECEGLSCEARCLGIGCSTTCRGFSCYYIMNGENHFGGGVWEDHYPQYDEANIRPSGY